MTDQPLEQNRPSALKVWLVAVRPFAAPAAVMPVLYGSVMAAYVEGPVFRAGLFLLTLFTVTMIAFGAHVLSDINDFRRGLDVEAVDGSGALVRGWLSEAAATAGSIVLFGIGTLTGILLVILVGNPLLIPIGASGLALGIFYTVRPLALKYRALGDAAIFCSYGTLGALGAWTVQTGRISLVPVLWGIPLSLLIVAILHANNWRDMERDAERGISTAALLLGRRGSARYYRVLIYVPYAVMILLTLIPRLPGIGFPPMPYAALLCILSLPLAVRLVGRSKAGAEPAPRNAASEASDAFEGLDVATAKLSLLFGLLASAGLLIAIFLHRL
jgi:1,4-dihydroxy-2-naphthoate octaprenyltransferase